MGTLESRIKALEQRAIKRASHALIVLTYSRETLTPEQQLEIIAAERTSRPCILVTGAYSGEFRTGLQ